MERTATSTIVLGSGLGLMVSIYNYFSHAGLLSPLSDTAGTPGALLVIGSTALMLVAGLAILAWPQKRLLVFLLRTGILLSILGTGFAALMLQSPPLVGAMAVTAVGWLIMVVSRRRRATPA